MFNTHSNIHHQKVLVHIPEIKRHCPSKSLGFCFSFNEPSAVIESPFQTLQLSFQDVKSQLGLRTQNSRFTKVSSTDDDYPESFKQQNTRATFFPQDSKIHKLHLQNFIKLIEKYGQTQQKDQKDFTINTKNILRNVCNAQNQYIMFNQSAEQMINLHTNESAKFKQWVNRLRFHTFEEFQRVWSSKKRSFFTKLYKKLCRKFYLENAIPYIMNSRIKNRETKKAHIRYLYRFLEGIQNPEGFFYFKEKDKEKAGEKEKVMDEK